MIHDKDQLRLPIGQLGRCICTCYVASEPFGRGWTIQGDGEMKYPQDLQRGTKDE